MFEDYDFKNTSFEEGFLELAQMMYDDRPYDAVRFRDEFLRYHGYSPTDGFNKRPATLAAEEIIQEYNHKFSNMDKRYLKNRLIQIIEKNHDTSNQKKSEANE